MRKPLSVLQAFQEDADGVNARATDFAPQLLDWVAAAQLACDLAAHASESADLAAERIARLLTQDPLLRELAAQRPTMVRDGSPPPSDPVGLVAERLRVMAEAMEQGGCFELALTTVSAVCRITAGADPVSHSLATLHLGRITRQMSDFESAEDCYRSAISYARHSREPPIAARGFIGLALVQDMRGNLPASARHYRQALRLAPPGGGAWVQAHQGLMSIAVVSDRLGDALEHGWAIYDHTDSDADVRASALGELAIVALKAGFPESARQGFTHALGLTASPRIRVTIWGGDVRAAAMLGDHDATMRAADELRREAASANLPYESALGSLRVAEALHTLGRDDEAVAELDTVRAIAQAHRFHELVWRADELEHAVRAAAPQPKFVEQLHSTVSTRSKNRRLRTAVARFATLG